MPIPWPAIGAVVLPNVGGWAGSYYTSKSIKTWYESLKRPEWRPPNKAFAPVWTSLYCGMGYASYLVWKNGDGFNGLAKGPLILYGTQLALNWGWTPIFFGAHNLKWSLVEICVLDVAVALCAFGFYNVDKTAGLLMLPYLAWLGVATALNYTIYRDNPTPALPAPPAEKTQASKNK